MPTQGNAEAGRKYVNENGPPVGDEWPQPGNPFSKAQPTEFPMEVLPDAVAGYVTDQARRMGVDEGMLAMFGLSVCAAAITDAIKIRPKIADPSWEESARPWVAVVGNPSIKKTPAFKAMAAPLWKQDAKWRKVEMANRRKQALAEKVYAKQERDYINALAKGEEAEEPTPPDPVEAHRAVVEDITIEALSDILKHTDRGTLIHADELSGFFGGMDAYRDKGVSKDRSHYLELYNGGTRRFDRVGRGAWVVENWGGGIVGGIQPKLMEKIARNITDDGLLQRFNLILARDAQMGQNVERDYGRFTAYQDMVLDLFDVQGADGAVLLSPGAEAVRIEMERFIHSVQGIEALPLGLRTHIGKWEGQFARYCLLFHVIEMRDRGRHPTDEDIAAGVASRVRELFMSYLLPHAMAFYAEVIGSNEAMDRARAVAGYILARSLEHIDRRRISQSIRLLKNHSAWDIHNAMDTLSAFGWVEPADQYAPHKKWLINPKVHTKFAEEAETERRRRQAEHAAIRGIFENVDKVARARGGRKRE